MKPKDKESKLPKPITPIEFVKDYDAEIEMLSNELHAISHLPDDLKKLIPNATELVRMRLRDLHQRECWILARNAQIKRSKMG